MAENTDENSTSEARQQADLETTRKLMAAIADAPSTIERIATRLSLSTRYVRDYLYSARLLGWIRFESHQLAFNAPAYSDPGVEGDMVMDHAAAALTPTGRELLNSSADTQDERVQIAKSIVQSELLRRVVGDLLSNEIDQETLAQRLRDHANLSMAIARRHARTLLAWKRYVTETSRSDAHSPRVRAQSTPPTPPTPRTKKARTPAVVGSTQSPKSSTSARLELTPSQLGYLRAQFEQARLMVLFGAGFSEATLTLNNSPPPTDEQLASMVWKLLFGEEEPDENLSLDDLIASATLKTSKSLAVLLKDSFTLRPDSIPLTYKQWLELPVTAFYTLAHDDLESATAKHHILRRTPTPVTAADDPVAKGTQNVAVFHLRGRVADGTATFLRVREHDGLGSRRRLLNQFDADFLAYPFLFVGGETDESLLWDYMQRRGGKAPRGTRELRPKSFLICPRLSRARRDLLDLYNAEWIQTDPLVFARDILSQFAREIALGHTVLAARAVGASHNLSGSIRSVAALLAAEKRQRTDYLLGKQPTWEDIRAGRAVSRDSDIDIETRALSLVSRDREGNAAAPVLVLTGTVGAGKSTALMRLCMKLSASGHSVGWVADNAEMSVRAIDEFSRSDHGFSVIAFDESDRFGRHNASKFLRRFSEDPRLVLVITTMHAARLDSLPEFMVDGQLTSMAIPKLTDSDVGRLLDALDTDHKLGVLTGKNRAYQERVFREKAGYLLLVAMIEATSGRRFEEKVYEEWSGLPLRASYFYTLITIATHLGYSASRDELLRAAEATRQTDDIAALESLVQGSIVQKEQGDRYRTRHRLIADTLMKELGKHTSSLRRGHIDLAYGITHSARPGSARNVSYWRFLKKLIRNRYLFQVLNLEDAREVYNTIESHLHWDYHYWLQRGSLEVSEGDVRLAEQYLNTAKGLSHGDDIVLTEYAYMLMRRAVVESTSPRASESLEEGVRILRGQISNRGSKDPYPYHVLGAQALAWVNCRIWVREERARFLEGVLRDLREGRIHHSRERVLEELEHDLRRKHLALTSGIEE